MKKKASLCAKVSAISLFFCFAISFFWSLEGYAMPSILGIATVLFAVSYFTFGIICSFFITE